jgi:hypothetical protein
MTRGGDRANYIVSARTVASVASLAALGLLATLAIVVGVKSVDILATVALALAILAFVVQLIVYVVQTTSSERQLADARTLHSEMMTVLTQLQERSIGTQQSIDLIREQVIEDLRAKAKGNFVAGEAASAAVSGSEAVASQRRETRAEPEYPPPLPPSTAAEIQEELSAWPEADEVADIVDTVTQLGTPGRIGLDWLVRDTLDFTEPGRGVGPGIPADVEALRRLISAGFAEFVPGFQLVVPSAKGRKYGRFYTAKGDPPDYIPQELIAMRSEMTELAKERARTPPQEPQQ